MWRLEARHVPPVRVPPCDLGSAMSSPVTLPFINLRKKNRRTQKRHFTQKQEVQRSEAAAVLVILDQKGNVGTKCIISSQ